jgi:hypothetical protein
MSRLFDPTLFSLHSLVGLMWTVLAFYLMFSARGRRWLSNPWSILVAGVALAVALRIVTAQIGVLTELAGGIKPLDVQYAYGHDNIIAFADALGTSGRRAYAMFQLGQDALAPPAFVCFLMAVYRATIRAAAVQSLCTALAFIYLIAVLIANNLMPVIMLNFPATDMPPLPLLYRLVPFADTIKYTIHGAAWLVIIAAWLAQAVKLWRSRG